MTLRTRHPASVVTGLLLVLLSSDPSSAAYIYVDNRAGNDAHDGTVSAPTGGDTGPVRTINQALKLARTGDTIEINNTGTPYHESIVLFGPRHSGYASAKFTIEGNGAVVDGSRPVPSDAWMEVGDGLWKISPYRKGHYQLLKNEIPLPEVAVPVNSDRPTSLAPGQWCAWRGSIYYRAAAQEFPPKENFRFAALGMGMTLYRIHDVTVRGLAFQNFRVDGINAPDLCQSVSLENVTSAQNGRSGLFVGGSAQVTATRSLFTENRDHQLLTRGMGNIQLDQSETTEQPVKVE